jgi:ATP-dependent DNA helicase HFM1/MER3
VIMTTSEKRIQYENLISGGTIIESSLHENLTEHLNAEIVLKNVQTKQMALSWLKSSFLYSNARHN